MRLPLLPSFVPRILVFPFVVCRWKLLSGKHGCCGNEEELGVGNRVSCSARLFLCIFQRIDIRWDALVIYVVLLHLILQRQNIERMHSDTSGG